MRLIKYLEVQICIINDIHPGQCNELQGEPPVCIGTLGYKVPPTKNFHQILDLGPNPQFGYLLLAIKLGGANSPVVEPMK